MKNDILQNLGYTQKMVYFSLLVVAIIALLAFFVVKPAISEIKDIKENIKDQRVQMEKKYLEGLNAKMLSRNAPEIKDNLKTLDRIFISKEGYLDLVTSLERKAKRNDLEKNLNILTNKGKDKNGYEVVPVHIETKGTFGSQLDFISDLKNATYQFNINTLKIRSEDPDAVPALRERPPLPPQIETTTTTVEIKKGTTTKEITVEKTPTTTPQKNLSFMIMGEVYWDQ